jgi:hypothetical protein
VTGLTPGTCYLFRVRARNEKGAGAFSAPLTPAKTGAGTPGPPASAPRPVSLRDLPIDVNDRRDVNGRDNGTVHVSANSRGHASDGDGSGVSRNPGRPRLEGAPRGRRRAR